MAKRIGLQECSQEARRDESFYPQVSKYISKVKCINISLYLVYWIPYSGNCLSGTSRESDIAISSIK